MGYQRTTKRRRRRRRHDDELVSNMTPAKDPVSDVQRALKHPEMMKNPDTLLAMQSLMGNQAVQRALVDDQTQRQQEDDLKARLAKRDAAHENIQQFFGLDEAQKMSDMFKELKFNPEEGFIMQMLEGKNIPPPQDNNVYTFEETASKQTGRLWLGDENVKHDFLVVQLIEMLMMPRDPQLGEVLSNSVYTATGLDGNIIGVTGLENEPQIGNADKLQASITEYPGLARFLDKEMAQKILRIEPELLELILQEIMPPTEFTQFINAFKEFRKELTILIAKESLLPATKRQEAILRGMMDKDCTAFDSIIQSLTMV